MNPVLGSLAFIDDPIFNEFVNLIVATLGFFVIVIFVRYLSAEWWSGGLKLRQYFSRRGRLRDQMATGLAAATIGGGIRNGWMWLASFLDGLGHEVGWMAHPPWLFAPVIGGSLEVAGFICIIKVFSPDEWGDLAWIVCLVVTTAIAAAAAVMRFG